MAAMVKAALYARISRPADEKIEVQLDRCRREAERRGWSVVAEYSDQVSAFSGKPRPEYDRLMQDVAGGKFDAIVVTNDDRLHRDLGEKVDFMRQVVDRNVAVATLYGDLDLETARGQRAAYEDTIGAWYQSKRASERIRARQDLLAADGQAKGGGKRPIGYSANGRDVIPAEAEAIREACRALKGGSTIAAVIRQLHKSGFQWAPRTVKRTLTSDRICGRLRRNGDVIGTAAWEPILSPSDVDEMRARLAGQRAGRPQARLLGGVAKCECGHALYGQKRGTLFCNPREGGCGASVMESSLNREVTKQLKDRWHDRAAAMLEDEGQPDPIRVGKRRIPASSVHVVDEARLDADRSQLVELQSMWDRREITGAEYSRMRSPVLARIEDAERQLADVLTVPVPEVMRRVVEWDRLDVSEQREVLRLLTSAITIRRAPLGTNRFDPARLEIVWRD